MIGVPVSGGRPAVADLHDSERVLDLGSGGGIDVLPSGPPVHSAIIRAAEPGRGAAQRSAARIRTARSRQQKGFVT
jgi:hypothetical protein